MTWKTSSGSWNVAGRASNAARPGLVTVEGMEVNDQVLRRIGEAYLAENPAPWWLDETIDPLGDLLTHPSRALGVFAPGTVLTDPLAQAAFTGLRFPYRDGVALLGPRFAVAYAVRCNGGRHHAQAYFNFVEPSDSDAIVQVALGLWNRTASPDNMFLLLDQAFVTARDLVAAR